MIGSKVKKQIEASPEKRLDLVFSEYIKVRDTRNYTFEPVCKCCNRKVKKSDWAETGHVEKRGNMATRWDEENAFLIHGECNRNDLPFNLPESDLQYLKSKAKSLMKFFKHELEEMILEYREKIKQLKQQYK